MNQIVNSVLINRLKEAIAASQNFLLFQKYADLMVDRMKRNLRELDFLAISISILFRC